MYTYTYIYTHVRPNVTSHLRVCWSEDRRDRCAFCARPNKRTKEDASDVGLSGDDGDITRYTTNFDDISVRLIFFFSGEPNKNGTGNICSSKVVTKYTKSIAHVLGIL